MHIAKGSGDRVALWCDGLQGLVHLWVVGAGWGGVGWGSINGCRAWYTCVGGVGWGGWVYMFINYKNKIDH